MKEDIEKIIIEFNNGAAKIYAILFSQFSKAVRNIDRNADENVFKMQAAKYADSLKYQIEEQVKKIMETADPKIQSQLQAALSIRVNYYLQEFQLKCNAV